MASCKSLPQIAVIPIRCNNATNHIQQRSHSSFSRKRESIRPPSVNTAASHRNGISGTSATAFSHGYYGFRTRLLVHHPSYTTQILLMTLPHLLWFKLFLSLLVTAVGAVAGSLSRESVALVADAST